MRPDVIVHVIAERSHLRGCNRPGFGGNVRLVPAFVISYSAMSMLPVIAGDHGIYKVVPILKASGVTRAALFGSVARGEQKRTSDVDLLVDLPADMSLFDVIDLESSLAAVMGRNVDLVDYVAIKPRLRPSIMHDQIPLL